MTARARAAIPLVAANAIGLAIGAPLALVLVHGQHSETTLVAIAAGLPTALGVATVLSAQNHRPVHDRPAASFPSGSARPCLRFVPDPNLSARRGCPGFRSHEVGHESSGEANPARGGSFLPEGSEPLTSPEADGTTTAHEPATCTHPGNDQAHIDHPQPANHDHATREPRSTGSR